MPPGLSGGQQSMARLAVGAARRDLTAPRFTDPVRSSRSELQVAGESGVLKKVFRPPDGMRNSYPSSVYTRPRISQHSFRQSIYGLPQGMSSLSDRGFPEA